MGALSVLGILFVLLLVINPLIGVAALTLILAIFMLIGGVGVCFRRSGCVGNRTQRSSPAVR